MKHAVKLQKVIKYCKKFLLLAKEKAILSYWCNWKLGIGGTHKYLIILPIPDNRERFI